MRLRTFIVLVLVCSGTAWAEEAPLSTEAVDTDALRLLDETPNYVEVLRNQWSAGLRTSASDISGRYFGLLRDTGEKRALTLEQCVALALQNNTGLKIGRVDPALAAAEVRSAYSIFDPAVFGETAKFRSNAPASSTGPFTSASNQLYQQNINWDVGVRKTILSGGQLALEWTSNRQSSNPNVVSVLVPEYTSGLDLTLNQPLLRDFGWRYALLQVDVAETVEEAAYFQYAAEVADLVRRVETLYWVVVLAAENVRVEQQGLDLARELLRQNEGRFKVGALPRTAVLESEAEVARREANLLRAQNLHSIALDDLRATINFREEGAASLLRIEPGERPAVEPYQIDLQSSFDSALANRNELTAARLDVDAKLLLRKAAENQLLPRLDLIGAIGLNGLSGRDATDPTNPNQFTQVDPRVVGGYGRALELLRDGRFYQYTIGAAIEIPLSNAAAKAEYAKANLEATRSRLNLRQLEEQVTQEVKTAADNLDSQSKSVDATRIARELAEENVRNQKARYDVGLATTKDLIDFQERLTRAQQEEIAALTRYNTSLADLRRADGTLLAHRNVQVRRVPKQDRPWWSRF